MAASPSAAPARLARPWYHPLRVTRVLVICATIAYAAFGIYLYAMQTHMIYEGYSVPVSVPEAVRLAKAVDLVPWAPTTPGAKGPQGYVRPDFALPAPRGTIVFFHGNGESAWEWVHEVAPFTQRGFRVFLYEYPGYGGRPGVPAEKTIVPDARAVVRSLDDAGFGPIYLWGESLGSGVAAAVCADQSLPIKGLTLVAPWDALPNVAASYYPCFPVRFLMTDQYDSIASLKHFRHPICVIRGDLDETIPPALSINLFAHLPNPKKMIVKTGYGHGDWPESPELPWWDEAVDFIAPRSSGNH
jgi:pimeloyl-ACP methyl ester carboxylesterase